MAFETTYNGQPAGSFTDYVTPIQPSDVSGKPIPYVVPGFNSTEYGATSHDSYHSNIAPDLANLVSELFAAGGAACGGIGGWKNAQRTAAAVKETNTSSVAAAKDAPLPVVSIDSPPPPAVAGEDVAAATVDTVAKSKIDTLVLPTMRLIASQLKECFGWLPLWQRPACKTVFQLGEKYAPKVVPALRGGLVGGVTGAVAGYITGYAAGAAADWCADKVVDTYNMLTGTGNSR